jgi:hypothetical protein
MTRYGFVASGGGYRSFYTEGVLVWLKRHGQSVVHIASTSSGNNIVIDYLLWDWQQEELPPVLTRTVRLNVTDIFHIFSNFLGLRDCFLDRTDHVEGLLRQVVVFPFEDFLEAPYGILELHILPRRSGESFGHMERLGKEALNFARARHGHLVIFRQLIHAENGDDVLQILIPLQHGLDTTGHLVMLFSDDLRVKNS